MHVGLHPFASTGHEARFATFLCALMKVRALKEDDAVDIALKIFVK